jgi:hypothetical protein
MDFKPRPRRNTNIDGFIAPQKKQPRAFVSSHTNVPLRSQDHMPQPPARPVEASVPLQPNPPLYPADMGVLPRPKLDKRGKPVAKKRWKKRVFRGALVAVVLFLVVGGWLGSRLLGNVDKVFHGNERRAGAFKRYKVKR